MFKGKYLYKMSGNIFKLTFVENEVDQLTIRYLDKISMTEKAEEKYSNRYDILKYKGNISVQNVEKHIEVYYKNQKVYEFLRDSEIKAQKLSEVLNYLIRISGDELSEFSFLNKIKNIKEFKEDLKDFYRHYIWDEKRSLSWWQIQCEQKVDKNQYLYLRQNKVYSFPIPFDRYKEEVIQKDLEFSKEKIAGYSRKYDIFQYAGGCYLKIENNSVNLYCKEMFLFKCTGYFEIGKFCIDKISVSHILYAIDAYLDKMYEKEDELSQLSFEYKIKNIFLEVKEFHQYLAWDSVKSAKWLKRNIFLLKKEPKKLIEGEIENNPFFYIKNGYGEYLSSKYNLEKNNGTDKSTSFRSIIKENPDILVEYSKKYALNKYRGKFSFSIETDQIVLKYKEYSCLTSKNSKKTDQLFEMIVSLVASDFACVRTLLFENKIKKNDFMFDLCLFYRHLNESQLKTQKYIKKINN